MDDPEYEVDDVHSHPRSASSARRAQAMPPGTLLSQRWRLALAASSLLLALIVIVSAWLPLHNQPHPVTAYPSATIQATPTRVLEPTPLPITSALGSPPTSCPSAPPLTTVTVPAFGGFFGGTVQLTGRAPVWIVDDLPPKVVDLTEQTPPSATNPEWPGFPIIWAFGPNAYPTVTVQVRGLQTGALAWWGMDSQSGPQVPILQLTAPVDISATQRYNGGDAPWLLYITQADCYKMDVTWPGGSWSLIFAAGQKA